MKTLKSYFGFTIAILGLIVPSINAEAQPGLRGIFIYTYDSSFIGADLQVQQLKPEVYEKFLAQKEFLNNPKKLSNSFDFLGILYGHCDIQLNCNRNICEKSRTENSCKCKNCEQCNTEITTENTPIFSTESTTTISGTTTTTFPSTTTSKSKYLKTTKSEIITKVTTPSTDSTTEKSLSSSTPKIFSSTSTSSPTFITTSATTTRRISTPGPPYLPVVAETTSRPRWTGSWRTFKGGFTYRMTKFAADYTGTWRTRRSKANERMTTAKYVNTNRDENNFLIPSVRENL